MEKYIKLNFPIFKIKKLKLNITGVDPALKSPIYDTKLYNFL
jgi:hypothetical protein